MQRVAPASLANLPSKTRNRNGKLETRILCNASFAPKLFYFSVNLCNLILFCLPLGRISRESVMFTAAGLRMVTVSCYPSCASQLVLWRAQASLYGYNGRASLAHGFLHRVDLEYIYRRYYAKSNLLLNNLSDNPFVLTFFSPTAWKAWGSSNKASGWFGAAARNVGPGSARFHIMVPLLKVQVPQGSTVKSSGSTRFHIQGSTVKSWGSTRFHIKVPRLKVHVPQGST